MLLAGAKTTLNLDEIGEGSVSLLPVEPEDMVRACCPLPPSFPLKMRNSREQDSG